MIEGGDSRVNIRWIVTAVAVALLAAGGAWWRWGPQEVEVVRPVWGPAIEAVYATGTVEPSVMVPIAPRSGGRLVELPVEEGASVRRGQVLARLDDRDLNNTVEELAARARYAQSQFDRTRELVTRRFLAQAEQDRLRAELDAATAALRRARSQRDFLALTAPADGEIIRRDGEVGQFVAAGQALLVMSCCAPLRVAAEVDEEDIARVQVGQAVVLRSDALPGRTFDAMVAELTPKGDPVARSYRVRLRLATPQDFRVGMTVDANIVVARRDKVLLVPAQAVRDGAVWLLREGRLHRQAVQVGVVGAQRTEIRAGLDAQAQIVLAPDDQLVEDRRARARAATAETARSAPAASAAR